MTSGMLLFFRDNYLLVQSTLFPMSRSFDPQPLSDSAKTVLEREGITIPLSVKWAGLDAQVKQDCTISQVFAHYLHELFQDAESPIRILDVGANPSILDAYHDYLRRREEDEKIPMEYGMFRTLRGEPLPEENFTSTFAGEVSQLANTHVVAVDIREPHLLTKWGDAQFIHGDFRDVEVRKTLEQRLGGKPHIITGNMIFVANADRYLREFDDPTFSAHDMHEELAQAALDFLAPRGTLFVANSIYSSGWDVNLPWVLRDLDMTYFYGNRGVRIYEKAEWLASA